MKFEKFPLSLKEAENYYIQKFFSQITSIYYAKTSEKAKRKSIEKLRNVAI